MTPLLILFAGVQPVVAIGTDLAYGAITKTVGGWRHLRSGTVAIADSGPGPGTPPNSSSRPPHTSRTGTGTAGTGAAGPVNTEPTTKLRRREYL